MRPPLISLQNLGPFPVRAGCQTRAGLSIRERVTLAFIFPRCRIDFCPAFELNERGVSRVKMEMVLLSGFHGIFGKCMRGNIYRTVTAKGKWLEKKNLYYRHI